MGKHKRSAARALDWLVSEGVEVVAVVAAEPDALTRDEQRWTWRRSATACGSRATTSSTRSRPTTSTW